MTSRDFKALLILVITALAGEQAVMCRNSSCTTAVDIIERNASIKSIFESSTLSVREFAAKHVHDNLSSRSKAVSRIVREVLLKRKLLGQLDPDRTL